MRVTLEPGDILTIPALWLHEVIADTTSISLNTWTGCVEGFLRTASKQACTQVLSKSVRVACKHNHSQQRALPCFTPPASSILCQLLLVPHHHGACLGPGPPILRTALPTSLRGFLATMSSWHPHTQPSSSAKCSFLFIKTLASGLCVCVCVCVCCERVCVVRGCVL